MKRLLIISVLLLALVALTACPAAPAATQAPAQPSSSEQATPATSEQTPAESGKTTTAIIGYTASNTGKLQVESVRQKNGLDLWIKQVNDAGGIKLADGSKVTFETRSYDDESNNDRIQELYTKLATDDKANFLISPYSSGLTASASVIAEQYGKPMITTGAASDSNYKQGYTLVYQAYTPASSYLTGAIDLLMKNAPDVKKIAVVHENDKFSTDVATALKAYAEKNGFEIALFEGYDSGATDFGPFINKIQQAAPQAILGGGHFQDGSTFARQLAEKGIDVPYLALLVAPPEPKFAELGDAAVGVIGPSQWEPQATYSSESASAAGLTYYGPSVKEFVDAYKAAYNEDPSYHAAGGYAAGLILQNALERAGSIDPQAVKAALDATDVMTFFGHIKFDTSAEAHGLQIGHQMVYVQWQKGSDGALSKQVVWPSEAASAKLITR